MVRDAVNQIFARLILEEAHEARLEQRRIKRRHDDAGDEILLDARVTAAALNHQLVLNTAKGDERTG